MNINPIFFQDTFGFLWANLLHSKLPDFILFVAGSDYSSTPASSGSPIEFWMAAWMDGVTNL